jgi:RimJ/RimL family protein N-acetyltransferase
LNTSGNISSAFARHDVALLESRDAATIAARLLADPDGLAATGAAAPRNEAAMTRLLNDALAAGARLWRVRIGENLFGAIVGEDPFAENDQTNSDEVLREIQRGLFVWLDPLHRGDDLGIQLVAETVKRLAEEGRTRLLARPPRSNYAALRILNALEFVYVGEEEELLDTTSEQPTRVRFERTLKS